MPTDPVRVTVWHEFRHEKTNPRVAEVYPHGMHEAIAGHLRQQPGLAVTTATLDEHEAGLTEDRLNQTDVLTWWGHMAHSEVQDLIVERVYHRVVRQGMGLVVLHSGHFSKVFRKLMGTTCDLKWRVEPTSKETLWVTRSSSTSTTTSCSTKRRCTASSSTCPSPTARSSSAASTAARCSAAA